MKKTLAALIFLLAGMAHGQFVPPPIGAYNFTSGSWAPFAATSGTASGFVPPAYALYCQLSNGSWTPWTASNCGGGGGSGVTSFTGDGTILSNSASTGAVTATLANTPTGTGGVVLANSPALTATPTAPTAALGTSTTQLATTAFVANQIAAIPANSTFVAGDTICALGGDTTIGQATITGGSSTSSAITIIVAGVQQRFFPGQLIGVTGATPSGFNVASVASTSVTISGTTTITFASTNNPGAWVSGGTVYIACSNATDAISTFTNFANNYTIPTAFVAGSHLRAVAQGVSFSSASNPGLRFQWAYGATPLFQTTSGGFMVTASNANGTATALISVEMSSVSANELIANSSGAIGSFTVVGTSALQNPTPITSAASTNLNLGLLYLATGVASGTYTSGITAVGTVGQTCTLTAFNNSSTATATVALTGTNTIAGGTALVITARGASATAAPTSATAGNGTATCSGTATVATVLGGIAGNAIELLSMTP